MSVGQWVKYNASTCSYYGFFRRFEKKIGDVLVPQYESGLTDLKLRVRPLTQIYTLIDI